MKTRLIQIILPKRLVDDLATALEPLDTPNWWRMPLADDREDPREQVFVLAKPNEAQGIMDTISDALEDAEDWRQLLLPVEAVTPDILTEKEREELQQKSITAAREEIVSNIRQNNALTADYLAMTALSTVVAVIGLNTDQVAAVIGAMVIAPLLGPIMALALGIALGLRQMMLWAVMTLAAGLAVCGLVSGLATLFMELNLESELLSYTRPVSLVTLALALASGGAAGLAAAGGRSSPLLGVMVSAALLPPVAAAGLLLAGGALHEAMRAAFIVVTNLICITLAAQLAFILKGVRPRRWSDVEAAETSRWLNLVALGALAAGLASIIWFWDVI